MTKEQFEAAYRAFRERRPFRPFMLEFTGASQVLVGHPEGIRSEAQLYLMRRSDGGYVIFPAESVTRFLDVPALK